MDEAKPLGLTKPGPTWSELNGSNSWSGLLNPLNDELRTLILRCGDFCQVTYDTFINEPYSKYCGSSRYTKANLLEKTAFPGGSNRYKVVSFLYATAQVSVPEAFLLKSRSREKWDRESNWIGYVAVSSDEASIEMGRREIFVPWRGTIRDYEWIDVFGAQLDSAKPLLRPQTLHGLNQMDIIPTPIESKPFLNWIQNNWITSLVSSFLAQFTSVFGYITAKVTGKVSSSGNEDDNSEPKIMQGWMTIYTSDDSKSAFTKLSARTQLSTVLKQLIEKYKGENISITFAGHSLGATLSVVSAFDVAENITSEIPITAVVFGCPKVGNQKFKDLFNSYSNLKVLHVRNVIDLIPRYPVQLMGYVNIGVELEIDTRKSHFLKDSKNPSDWHNLQAILHIVNGWHGAKGGFEAVTKRSIALVNKSCDFLKEECLVPPSWWIEKNKGMVLNEDGEWVMGNPEIDPIPEFD